MKGKIDSKLTQGEVVCPWCGYKDPAYFEFNEIGNYNCGACDKEFFLEFETVVYFTTTCVERGAS